MRNPCAAGEKVDFMFGGYSPVKNYLSTMTENLPWMTGLTPEATDVVLSSLDTNIATTPYEIVYEEDHVKLKHFKPEISGKVSSPLLINYALINKETMLDLQPGRSLIQKLLSAGIELYVIDWGYPSKKDQYLTIDDHVNWYLDNMVDFVCKEHNQTSINLMGICMGGTFSVMYAALHPEKVKNLITTVTPTNFDTDQGLLHIWMKEVNAAGMMDTFGNMPGDMMNLGFLMLNPARLMIDKYEGFMENLNNREFVENFMRMEKWIFDSPDVPGETFKQFVEDCYQKNLLIANKMKLDGKTVNLKKITMPLLNIYGELDHLVPPEAAEKLPEKVGSTDTENVCIKTGHIGIYVSSKSQKEFAPKIISWLEKHDGKAKATEVKKKGTKK
jgi:poly[(R)-3-hydroxyalkanoate] polymerase subunit PhaC